MAQNNNRTFVIKDCDVLYNELLKRAKILGIRKEIAVSISRDFTRWYKQNGPEFAVSRMKYIYTVILNYLANPTNPSKISSFEESKKHWIKKRNPYIFSGHYGFIQTDLNLVDAPMVARNYLMFLKMYTIVAADEVDYEMIQAQKAIIEYQSSKSDNQLNAYLNMLAYDNMRMGIKEIVGPCKAYRLFRKDSEKPKPFILSKHKSMSTERRFWKQAFNLSSSVGGKKLLESNELLRDTMDGIPVIEDYSSWYGDLILGDINCILDPGLKNRFVLDCSKVFENALVPFEAKLASLIKELPWDITYDEEKCFAPIMAHLRVKDTCYAVDLSQATDRFPWETQYFLCMNLFQDCPNMVASIDIIDKMLKYPGKFRTPDPLDRIYGYWKTGQPMGLLGSFAMFTLTHGCILFALNEYKYNGEFYIHGDDVVILSKELYDKYKTFLDECDIPYNPFKTIVSDIFTEINSKIITADTVLVLPKWRPIRSDNVKDMATLWSPDVINSVYKSEGFRSIAKLALQLPTPYGINSNHQLSESELQIVDRFESMFFNEIDTLSERINSTNICVTESNRDLVLRRYRWLWEGNLPNHCYQKLLQCLELASQYDEIDHNAIIAILPLTLLTEIANWDVSYSRRSLRINMSIIDNINKFMCNVTKVANLLDIIRPKVDVSSIAFADEIDWTDEERGYCLVAERHLHRITPSSDRLSAIIKHYSSTEHSLA